MRKIVLSTQASVSSTSLGLENQDLTEEQLTDLDNKDLIQADMEDSAEEASELSMESLTLIRKIAALEDIAQVIEEQVDEARPSDVILVDIASDLAVEGTDMEDKDVTPGLESAIGTRISSEGIRETIRGFMNALKERIEKVKDNFRAFAGSVKAMFRLMHAKLIEVKKKLSESDSVKTEVASIPLLADVAIDGNVAKSLDALIVNVTAFKKSFAAVYDKYASESVELFSAMESALKEDASPSAVATQWLTTIKKFSSKKSSMASKDTAHDHPIILHTGKDVLLNLWPSAVDKLKDFNPKESDSIAVLKSLEHSVFYSATAPGDKDRVVKDAKSVTFSDVSKEKLLKLLTVAEETLKNLEAQPTRTLESFAKMDNLYKQVTTYLTKAPDAKSSGSVLPGFLGAAMIYNFEGALFLKPATRAISAAITIAEKCAK